MGVSLKPSDAVAGGGGIDDVDVAILSARFRMWDYNGQIQTPVLGLEVTYVDDEGGQSAQVYSAGDIKHFVPSEDGTEAVQVGSHPNLNDSTNAMAWMVSMVNGGFPEDKIGDKVSVFDGTRVHVNQQPQVKRKGLKNAAANQDNKMILLVTKVLALPWEKAKGPAKAAPKAAPATGGAVQTKPVAAPVAAAAAAPAGDLNDAGISGLIGIIMGKGGSIAKSQIAQEAFKAFQTDPNRNALVQLVYSEAFLKQDNAPWTFDGTTVSMG